MTVAVLSFLNQIEARSSIGLLGIGLACLAIASLGKKDK